MSLALFVSTPLNDRENCLHNKRMIVSAPLNNGYEKFNCQMVLCPLFYDLCLFTHR